MSDQAIIQVNFRDCAILSKELEEVLVAVDDGLVTIKRESLIGIARRILKEHRGEDPWKR